MSREPTQEKKATERHQPSASPHPCPKCDTKAAVKVSYTWWGGALGPRLLSVVKCRSCGTQYNGAKGGRLGRAILVYNLVLGGILGTIAFFVLRR